MELAGRERLDAAGVTGRESEVLAAIGLRLTNREIAAQMCISVRTVESHVSALLRKLAAPDRAGLIRLAQRIPAEPSVPRSPTTFVGRDHELGELADLLAAGQLVCLTGPAGCGKTRLALEAAHGWPGEARMVDLASGAAGDVSALIAGGLGVSCEASDLAATARVALAGRAMLIVADNCDHVVAAAAQVLGDLVRAVPDLRIIATSRQPLGIDAERVLPVGPLSVPSGDRLDDVRASAACRLFADRALAAAPGFVLGERSAPYVAAICGQLDGLPLAIELAAARARTLDIAALADSIASHSGLFEQPGKTERHRSLYAAIDWSWQLLDDSERALLGRLAALPGEFTLPLAEAACADPLSHSPRRTLLRLVDRSLVSVRLAAGEPARYRLLGVIRAFAREHLPPEVAEQVSSAHARYHRDLAVQMVRGHLGLAPPPVPIARFDEPNMLAALAWSARSDPALADSLLSCIAQIVERHPTRRAVEAIRDIAAAHRGGWSSESLARAGQLVTYISLDDADHLAGLSRLRAEGEADTAYADLVTGWVLAYRHDEAKALGYLDRVISYARSAGDTWLEGSAWQARGLARVRDEDAFDDWERAVARFVAAGDLMHAHNARYMLASRAVRAGLRLAEVPVLLAECETYATRLGYPHELAHVRLTRAAYERISGSPEAARPMLDSCLPVFRNAGDLRCVARTLVELASHEAGHDPPTAADLLLQALPAAAMSDTALVSAVLSQLIAAAAAADDLVLAARCLGALQALDGPDPVSAVDPALTEALTRTAYATFYNEARTGGIELLTALYPR